MRIKSTFERFQGHTFLLIFITTGRIENALQNRRLSDRGLVLRRLLHGRRLGDRRVAGRANLLGDLSASSKGSQAAKSSSDREGAWIDDPANASCARQPGDRMNLPAVRQLTVAKCRYGSGTTLWGPWPDVGFTPDSDRDGDLQWRACDCHPPWPGTGKMRTRAIDGGNQENLLWSIRRISSRAN
jgi:hypothetical protein